MAKTLTDAQVKAKARKKKRLAALKNRTDRVIDRRTHAEFAKYYTPRGRLLDVIEAAKLLKITKRRVREFINLGRLPAVRLNRLYLIKYSDFMLFKKTPRLSGAPYQEKTEKSKR